jgi:CHAD domain
MIAAPSGAELKQRLINGLATARSALDSISGEPDVAVHEARKRLKRVNTLFLLLKPVAGADRERRAETAKQAFRLLSQSRDADALLERARWLEARADDAAMTAALRALVNQLELAVATAHAQALPIGEIVHLLRMAEADAASLADGFSSSDLIADGLIEAYRNGRELYRKALDGAGAETMHDWRKQVKHRLHISELIENRHPAASPSIVADLDRLGYLLGESNDFANLRDLLKKSPEIAGNRKMAEKVLDLIARRRRKLEKRALELGEELYGERTRRFSQLVSDSNAAAA